MSNCPERIHTQPARDASSSCFMADRRLISALSATYLSNGPLTLLIEIVDSVNGPFER